MKHKLILLLALLQFFELKAQDKQLNQALNGNRSSNGCFVAKFKQPQPYKALKKWCDQHSQVVIDTTIGYAAKFGDIHEGVVSLSFMPKKEYEEIERRLAAERAAQKERDERDKLAVLGIAVLGGLILVKGAEMILSSGGSGGGGGYSGQSNAPPSNTGTKKQEPAKVNTPCYGKAVEYGTALLRCNAKVRDKYYKIKCGDGAYKYYFFLPEKNTSGLCSDQIGYRELDQTIVNFGSFLGTDYDKAMKKLCNCN